MFSFISRRVSKNNWWAEGREEMRDQVRRTISSGLISLRRKKADEGVESRILRVVRALDNFG